MLIFLSIVILSLVGFLIHYLLEKRPHRFRTIELFLLYQLVFSVGGAALLAFIGYLFFPDLVAESLGWNMCPFQHELANASLGYGVLGILCIWFRGHFWTATIIGRSIWLLGDGIAHLYHMIIYKNFTPGNSGVPLYTDFIIPSILLISLFFYLIWRPRKRA